MGVIAIHSYKGGTGKSVISVNLASALANEGKDVALLDLDLRAPSLDATFKAEGKHWINDLLEGRCEPLDVLTDYSKQKGTPGRLFVALANPAMEAIRETVGRDKRWEVRALRRLLRLRDYLLERMGVQHMLLDTSPGLSYASINSVAVADLVLVITTWDASDISGTQGMVNELYRLLERRAAVLMNKVPEQLIANEDLRKRMVKQFKSAFKLPVVDLLPCYCDVLQLERNVVMVLERPEHPFSRMLVQMARGLDKLVAELKPRPSPAA